MHKLKFFVVPLIAFLMITGVTAFLSFMDYSWSNWKSASCMPDACFCEAIHSGAIAQPSNTWSSFGFVLIGLLVVSHSRQVSSLKAKPKKLNPMTVQLSYAVVYGISLVIIGLGSVCFHASLTFFGQIIDIMGMYLLVSFMLIYNISRMYPIKQGSFFFAYLVLNLVLMYVQIQFPAIRRYTFATMIVAALVIEYQMKKKKNPSINKLFFQAALLALGIGFCIWTLDVTNVLCAPNSWAQGHAIWHILGAIATGFLYLYYRSENVEVQQVA